MTRHMSAGVRRPNRRARVVGSRRHPREPQPGGIRMCGRYPLVDGPPFDYAKVYALEGCPESSPHGKETEWDRGSTGP